MRLLKPLAAILVLLAVLAPTAGAAGNGQRGGLDRSFGTNGKLILPPQVAGEGAHALLNTPSWAQLPSPILRPLGKGRFLVLDGRRLFRFEADGELDAGFGQAGYEEVPAPAGQTLVPRSITVDSRGRILVAGEAKETAAQGEPTPGLTEFLSLNGPAPVSAAIERLLPNGQVDSSFGSDGVSESTFGLPVPTHAEYSSTTGAFVGNVSYAHPAAQGLAVSIDSTGRLILSGAYVTEAVECPDDFYMTFFTRAFVARLSATGQPEQVSTDPTVGGAESSLGLNALGGNRFAYVGYESTRCPKWTQQGVASITALNSAGNAVPGYRPTQVQTAWAPSTAVDSKGRVLITGFNEGSPSEGAFISRLGRDGSIDKRFGGGRADLPEGFDTFGSGSGNVLAVDSAERPIVATAMRKGFGLVRLTTGGKIDRSFGPGGTAEVAFNGVAEATRPSVMIDGQGRIVVAARDYLVGGGDGLAIARYVPPKE
jgi:uncharacterized delta-60 repeat protein